MSDNSGLGSLTVWTAGQCYVLTRTRGADLILHRWHYIADHHFSFSVFWIITPGLLTSRPASGWASASCCCSWASPGGRPASSSPRWPASWPRCSPTGPGSSTSSGSATSRPRARWINQQMENSGMFINSFFKIGDFLLCFTCVTLVLLIPVLVLYKILSVLWECYHFKSLWS